MQHVAFYAKNITNITSLSLPPSPATITPPIVLSVGKILAQFVLHSKQDQSNHADHHCPKTCAIRPRAYQ